MISSFFLFFFVFPFFFLQDHSLDDQDEESEDTKLLLDFCKMQKQLIQTHESITKLYKDESESMDEVRNRRNEKQVNAR